MPDWDPPYEFPPGRNDCYLLAYKDARVEYIEPSAKDVLELFNSNYVCHATTLHLHVCFAYVLMYWLWIRYLYEFMIMSPTVLQHTDYELVDCLDVCVAQDYEVFAHFNFTAKPKSAPLNADDFSTKAFFAEIQSNSKGVAVPTQYCMLDGELSLNSLCHRCLNYHIFMSLSHGHLTILD